MVTKTSMNNNKGQYPNNYGAECYVLSTALVLNEIYQPTHFLVDNTCVFSELCSGQSVKMNK